MRREGPPSRAKPRRPGARSWRPRGEKRHIASQLDPPPGCRPEGSRHSRGPAQSLRAPTRKGAEMIMCQPGGCEIERAAPAPPLPPPMRLQGAAQSPPRKRGTTQGFIASGSWAPLAAGELGAAARHWGGSSLVRSPDPSRGRAPPTSVAAREARAQGWTPGRLRRHFRACQPAAEARGRPPAPRVEAAGGEG